MIVSTAGGIEEDFIKCMAPTYLGDFHLKGKDLRERGINRIGNLLVPNDNYCRFEDWIMPILDQMLLEQKEQVLNFGFGCYFFNVSFESQTEFTLIDCVCESDIETIGFW